MGNDASTVPYLDRIADLLVCPMCSASVAIGGSRVECTGCKARYPIRNGVPRLARAGTSSTWRMDADVEGSEEYQRQYKEVVAAAAYNEAYRAHAFKRWTTAREYKLLHKLLESQGHCGVLLDIPCGGGRLSRATEFATDLIIEADIAPGQVLYGKENTEITTPQVWLTASAFHIPLRDSSVDGTVCSRLCHHLPSAEERERLIEELLRVSRRFVIMTFFDHHSVKNTLRRMRRPFDRKPPKLTMTRKLVAQLAEKNGARLVASPALAYFSSGHRYALMVKKTA